MGHVPVTWRPRWRLLQSLVLVISMPTAGMTVAVIASARLPRRPELMSPIRPEIEGVAVAAANSGEAGCGEKARFQRRRLSLMSSRVRDAEKSFDLAMTIVAQIGYHSGVVLGQAGCTERRPYAEASECPRGSLAVPNGSSWSSIGSSMPAPNRRPEPDRRDCAR